MFIGWAPDEIVSKGIPALAAATLAASALPLGLAWKSARGMALRPSMAWGMAAVVLGVMAQLAAGTEALATGRPAAGHWAYLASLAALAALVSVLGARNPGGGAWAILMAMLVVIFLVPWLEGSGLSGGAGGLDRLHLDPTWAAFFAVVAGAGVTNYLPTRFGAAAALVGLGLGCEWSGVCWPGLGPEVRAILWSAGPLLGGTGILLGSILGRQRPRDDSPSDRLWLWFRDRWGVVWAMRVRERYNRSASAAGWSSLSWEGMSGGDVPVPGEAHRTLLLLLRRFAEIDVLERAAGDARAEPCPDDRGHA